jgi:dihydropteroate synthase
VLPLLREVEAPLSIDTRHARVADVVLAAGAVVLNDVSGLAERELADVAAEHGAFLVLTHNGWTTGRRGGDMVDDVVATLSELIDCATRRGVAVDRLLVDPGLGFGKPAANSLVLLRRLAELGVRLSPLPLLVGASRKGFIGHVLGVPPNDRLEGSLACATVATLAGASVIRVHDVAASVRTLRMAWAIRGIPRSPI